MASMQKITPSLWFDNNAEEAMKFYTSVFRNSEIVSIEYYPEHAEDEHLQGMEGKVLHGVFELDGQQFVCLDGGSVFTFNEAISFIVECKDQEEIDYFWDKLSAVPDAEQCGWCKDKFGLSWQIVPKQLGEMMADPDKKKASRTMEALIRMKKLNIAELRRAFEGK